MFDSVAPFPQRRLDAALFVALAALSGAYAVETPLATGAVAVGVLALCHRRASARVVALAVALTLLGAVRARTALQEYEASRIEARDAIAAPSRCSFSGVVLESPTWRGDGLAYLVRADRMECEERTLRAGFRVRLYGGPRDLSRGDVVEVVAQLGPVRLFQNAALPSPLLGAARSGAVLSGGALSVVRTHAAADLASWIDRARARVRDRIEATFAPNAVGMAKALVLGENDLTQVDDEAFKRSGLAHLLAVSGTHLVFAVLALVRGLTFVLVRIESLAARYDVVRLACLGGVPLALLYADFAGGSGSAWRAAWMLAAGFLVRASARRPRPARVVAASVFVGWWLDPLVAFDLSFLLSLGATGGLIVLGQPWSRAFGKKGGQAVQFLAQGAIATIAAMLPCIPLLALVSADLTLAGIFANVAAGPFGEVVALPLCLSHALLSFVPALERGVALVASGALLVVKQIAHTSAAAEWSRLSVFFPHAWHFCVTLVGAFAVWRVETLGGDAPAEHRAMVERGLCAFITLTALGAIELVTIRDGSPRGALHVTALDVEQGDATLLELPDGTSMLIDAGGFVGSPVDPGERVILPLLRRARRTRLDVVVLSHPHPDHFGGLLSVARRVPIGEFWDSGQGEAEGAGPAYAELLATLRARGTTIRRPGELCGKRWLGGAEVEIMGPCPGHTPNVNANDNSLVLRVSHDGHSALFMGDAEAEEEKKLLSVPGLALGADFLKVGHHGSRTSTSLELLDRVRPQIATISCGVRNRFGHPHAVTLDHLAVAGVPALRLDRTGSVEWTTAKPDVVRVFSLPH